MYCKAPVAAAALAFAASGAVAAGLSSSCQPKLDLSELSDLSKVLSLDELTSTLKQGAQCGASEVSSAVSTLENMVSSLQKEAGGNTQQLTSAVEEHVKDMTNQVACSYNYITELSKNATSTLQQVEKAAMSQVSHADLAKSVDSLECFYKELSQAVTKIQPYAPYVATVKTAVKQLSSAEAELTSSMQKYSSELISQVHSVVESTDGVMNQAMAGLNQSTHTIADLVQHLL
ncbi:unnamed protein product [Parajaminaea phylloscopi]